MPNWTTNKLTIAKGFDNAIHNPDIAGDRLGSLLKHFSFQKIIPMPEDTEDEYHWKIDNWDTKWDAVGLLNQDETVNLFASKGYFLTAWSPPLAVIRKMQEMFPEFSLTLEYVDEGFMYGGKLNAVGDESNVESLWAVGEYAIKLGTASPAQVDDMLKEERKKHSHSSVDYLDPAIQLIKCRLDDLEMREPNEYEGVEEEVYYLNTTYQLLVDLESGKKGVLSLGEPQSTNK